MDPNEIAKKIIELVRENARYTMGEDGGFSPSFRGGEILADKWAMNVNLWHLEKDLQSLFRTLKLKK